MSPTAYQPWTKPESMAAEAERRQSCLFCRSAGPELPVYSACVGRLGITQPFIQRRARCRRLAQQKEDNAMKNERINQQSRVAQGA